jgi:hypothetical protein
MTGRLPHDSSDDHLNGFMFQCGVWAATFVQNVAAIFWDRIFHGDPGATADGIAHVIWAELRSRGVLDAHGVATFTPAAAPSSPLPPPGTAQLCSIMGSLTT